MQVNGNKGWRNQGWRVSWWFRLIAVAILCGAREIFPHKTSIRQPNLKGKQFHANNWKNQNLVYLLSAKPAAPGENMLPNRLVVRGEYRKAVGNGNRQEHILDLRVPCAVRR
ncbi:hypothetical protein DFJ58DRAFT_779292 [Suillus subalutaceus]|uniref:uncharacterized protein n=1 Tax=Suillus subalutaceus TaxID=48586 RepID=UPI001B85F0A8|nr:uncharacterized protein DFJ58DRAFT_779292 [Suillus subalutaceus]KAG1860317.1 hypothetical protein DFJ58DRAFT_779292 [Suillus subalutaceus]